MSKSLSRKNLNPKFFLLKIQPFKDDNSLKILKFDPVGSNISSEKIYIKKNLLGKKKMLRQNRCVFTQPI